VVTTIIKTHQYSTNIKKQIHIREKNGKEKPEKNGVAYTLTMALFKNF